MFLIKKKSKRIRNSRTQGFWDIERKSNSIESFSFVFFPFDYFLLFSFSFQKDKIIWPINDWKPTNKWVFLECRRVVSLKKFLVAKRDSIFLLRINGRRVKKKKRKGKKEKKKKEKKKDDRDSRNLRIFNLDVHKYI